MSAVSIVASAVALAACVTDIRSRRIPNALTFGASALALVFHTWSGGLAGLGQSMLGWVVGLLMFLPVFVLGGLGGGDIKLMAALGAWLGSVLVFWVAVWAALSGGVLALAVVVAGKSTRRTFGNVWGMLSFWRVAGLRPHPVVNLESAAGPRLPYSVPIAAGLGLTLWLG